MKKYIKTLLVVAFFGFFNKSEAQNYTIDQEGSYTTCSTTMYDSDSSGFYQNNENYTITFCSDGTGGGNTVNVGFGELFSIDPSDTLYVYDGSSTSSPLIGAYNNDNPPVGVTSTTANPSGCITFKFVSDGAIADTGWIAILNCVKVCQPIDPIVTTVPALTSYGPDSSYTNICAGDTVFFSASAAYPHNGINGINYTQSDATSTYEWNFGEGTESTNQNEAIIYDSEGGFAVLLTITDANGCQEQIIHKVRTGITPTFSGILAMPDSTCFGDTILLMGGFNQITGSGSGVSPNSGAITAGGTVTGQTFLPDGNGNSYTTSVGISGFPGQTINAGTDIETVCMNIEHSYIGDLDFQLTCPNGTTIMLADNYGGGGSGGTFLGDANDDGSNDPGIGMDYCFTLGAAMGTMVDENIAGNYIPSTFDPGNNILTPGDFLPEESFNSLIGCPIDGNWTITVTDNIGADNGYIFEWGITLNPDINPNSEFYDVAIADGFWQASPDIIASYDSMSVAYTQVEGENQYIFQVTDEYGCEFDTTISVFVLEELNAIMISDTSICEGQQVQLDVLGISGNLVSCQETASVTGQDDDPNTDVTINSFSCIPAGADITSITLDAAFTGTNCPNWYTYDIIINGVTQFTQQCNQTDLDLSAFLPITSVTISANDEDAFSDNVTIDLTLNLFYQNLSFSWGPTIDLSDPMIQTPIFNGTTTNTYAVEVFNIAHPECSVVSDSITIGVSSNDLPTIAGDSAICFGASSTFIVNGADSVFWPDNSNSSTFTFSPQNDSLVSVTATTGCGSVTWNKHVVVYPQINLSASPDTVICEGDVVNINLDGILDECTYLLTLSDAVGDGWSGFEGVDVKINGIIYESGVAVDACTSGSCSYSMVIPINEGDILTLEYISGATDIENTVQLFDANNTELLNTTNPSAGLLGTFNATCSNAYSISWTPSTQLSDASIANPIFTAVTSENYQAAVVLNSNNNCSEVSNTISMDVRSVVAPTLSVIDTALCIGETTTLSVNADNILWWPDSTTSSSFTFTPQNDSLISVTASTFCVSELVLSQLIIVNPLPIVTTISDTIITIQDEITLTTTGGENYLWSPADFLSCVACQSPIAKPTENITYFVTVQDSNGCISSGSVNIEIVVPDLFIPNGFSPNGDGLNDFVDVRSKSISLMTIQIFDKWGTLIFESNDQKNSWDGTHNGKKLDAGVYVYKFEASMVDQTTVEQSGTITLFR
ncbi:T9SS type B sorting domain-containing protein [Vicingus serpentipes]|uniref:T9SS type B sorting domain-containing protein n=1 Tax=Vicingus serpentipes TaxID=1926625 RepID=A0A5C6RQZ4_9FLAO|nr:gliding motility-associated C-terminal domain-containing protein [Vicingus serpentipes]TXB64698.1 T9SS type B sorting domain-containing protein [Vicingus serpentipes]